MEGPATLCCCSYSGGTLAIQTTWHVGLYFVVVNVVVYINVVGHVLFSYGGGKLL